MQPQHHPNEAFASDAVPTYRSIAAQVEQMKVRALSPDQYEDVVVMLEYMRDTALKQHEANIEVSDALKARELDVSKREKELAMRSRVVDAVLKIHPPRKRWYLWG